jgi:membrane associated rhomboid family serine protease
MRITEAVKHLIIINVLLFIITQLYGEPMLELLALWFPKNEHFMFWQILSHMFMHGSIIHIFFNMYALWAFGAPLEEIWGRNRFLFFYFSAGLGAALVHTGVNYYYFNQGVQALTNAGVDRDMVLSVLHNGQYNKDLYQLMPKQVMDNFLNSYMTPVVGASGAIYGILVAFAMMFPNAQLLFLFLPFPIKAKYFVPLLVVSDLFFGFTSYSAGPIAHFAHVGGALFGFIMMWYFKKNQLDKNHWDR